jgi:hypothetical protein
VSSKQFLSNFPDGICQLYRCHQITRNSLLPSRNEIYVSDLDYKGHTSLLCNRGCKSDFHSKCWADFKAIFPKNYISDQKCLEMECLKPNCTGKYLKTFSEKNVKIGSYNIIFCWFDYVSITVTVRLIPVGSYPFLT